MARLIWQWVALTVPVTSFLLCAGGSPTQAPFLSGSDPADNSNFILAALHSNLKAWPSAYAPNGRAMVPTTIKRGTLLYHSGVNPSGMEWFAFDAEHSYGYGGGGLQGASRDSPSNLMYTYAATRPLRAVYFDGFSAAKHSGGALEMQDMLIGLDSKVGNPDVERGRLLCEWGKQYGIQGFVREQATFELLWCDFADGVQMLSVTNITIPANPDFADALQLDTQAKLSEEEPRSVYGPPSGYDPDGTGTPTPYYSQSDWSCYRATAWHHTVPDTRVILHPAYTVTLYDPQYTSLAANTKLPRHRHRISDLSAADEAVFRAELDAAMIAWTTIDPRGEGSGVDWSSIAHAIVERSGDRLAELHTLLIDVSATSNATEIVSTARLIVFAIIMPYVDHAAVFASAISAHARSAILGEVSTQCSLAFTGHIDAPLYRLTPQEQRLKRAAEGVSRRICSFATGIFDESLNLLDSLTGETEAVRARAQAVKALERWLVSTEELMEWLGWSMWQRCPDMCAWDEVCYIPMWPFDIDRPGGGPGGPVSPGGGGRRDGPGPVNAPDNSLSGMITLPLEDEQPLKPRCAKRSEFMMG